MSLKEKIYQAFSLPDEVLGTVGRMEPDPAMVPRTDDERDAIEDYDADFLVRFNYNSNAIEGSTLDLGDTELVLEGEFPSDVEDKRLKDVFAALGCQNGCSFAKDMLDSGAFVDEELVKDLHEKTALEIQPRARGTYRVSPVYIRHSETVPANPDQVRSLMADLMFAYDTSKMPPIAKAAAFHAMFENIHPFRDGNGRTGRIILNYMLQQAGFPPIAIKAEGKARYLKALEDWQVRDDPAPFLELVASCIEEETCGRKEAIQLTRAAVISRDNPGISPSQERALDEPGNIGDLGSTPPPKR